MAATGFIAALLFDLSVYNVLKATFFLRRDRSFAFVSAVCNLDL